MFSEMQPDIVTAHILEKHRHKKVFLLQYLTALII